MRPVSKVLIAVSTLFVIGCAAVFIGLLAHSRYDHKWIASAPLDNEVTTTTRATTTKHADARPYPDTRPPYSTGCPVCRSFANVTKPVGNETMVETRERTLAYADAIPDNATQILFKDMAREYFPKAYGDAKVGLTEWNTCADMGYCEEKYAISPPITLVDVRDQGWIYSKRVFNSVRAIIIHDTETVSLNDTWAAFHRHPTSSHYLVDKDGSVYLVVSDYMMAWHAGVGAWRDFRRNYLNHYAVGIEVVNRGSEPFPDEQQSAINSLVAYLRDKWHIDDANIFAHADSNYEGKEDISGWYSWQGLYKHLGVWNGLFDSKLSSDEQTKILIDYNSTDSAAIQTMQEKLYRWGYTWVPHVNATLTKGVLDNYTHWIMDTFNRHYAPEIFTKEVLPPNATDVVRYHVNQQWYGVSEERLNWLLTNVGGWTDQGPFN